MSLYFTHPIARPAVWGGKRLAEYFGFHTMDGCIGQAWAFSCQQGNESPLEGGGSLGELWRTRPDLFQSRFDTFPFIISLVAPMDDLSIQVHPNDAVAQKSGYPYGKNEAWVFLQAPASGQIVYGQTASDAAQLRTMVNQQQWDVLLSRLKVNQDDFVYVPAGMVHALTGGCVAYEVQQATDVTYRFYDYHRTDAQGRQRQLHVQEAIACVDFTLGTKNAALPPQTMDVEGVSITTYIQNDSFCIRKLRLHQQQTLQFSTYQLATVVHGEGHANGHPLFVGRSFFLPANEPLTIGGNVTLMVTGE